MRVTWLKCFPIFMWSVLLSLGGITGLQALGKREQLPKEDAAVGLAAKRRSIGSKSVSPTEVEIEDEEDYESWVTEAIETGEIEQLKEVVQKKGPDFLLKVEEDTGSLAVYAVENGELPILEYLVKVHPLRAAILEQADEKGKTPLFRAIELGAVDIIEYLVEAAPSKLEILNTVSVRQWAPVLVAAQHNEVGVIEFLVEVDPRGVEILNTVSPGGWSVALVASRYGNTEILDYLKEASPLGSSILEATGPRGRTPASVAAQEGQVHTLKYLVSTVPREGAILEEVDASGKNLAFIAAEATQLKVLQYLVSATPSSFGILSLHNHRKETPIDVLLGKGDSKCIKWLFQTYPHTLEKRDILQERGRVALSQSNIIWLQNAKNRAQLEGLIQEAGVVPGLTEEMAMINSVIEVIQQLRVSAEKKVSRRGAAYREVLDLVLQALREPILKHTALLRRNSSARGGV